MQLKNKTRRPGEKNSRERVTDPSSVHPWIKVWILLWLCATHGPQINAQGFTKRETLTR